MKDIDPEIIQMANDPVIINKITNCIVEGEDFNVQLAELKKLAERSTQNREIIIEIIDEMNFKMNHTILVWKKIQKELKNESKTETLWQKIRSWF